MAVEDRRVVWILGAGFSVPLGGPLFRELISVGMCKRLCRWEEFRKQVYVADVPNPAATVHYSINVDITADVITRLYRIGLGKEEADPERLWADAEQFLNRIEIAANEPDGPLAHDIKSILRSERGGSGGPTNVIDSFILSKHGLHKVRQEAIRYVAGACSAFLNRYEKNPYLVDRSEEWEPYRRWVMQLAPGQDAVVTFNYDRVIDLLEGYRTRRFRQGLFHVPVTEDEVNMPFPQCVSVYHLHGNVSWKLQADDKTIYQAEEPIAHRSPDRAVMGVPGDDKLNLPLGRLNFLWDAAMKAISEADAVVLCGYRFPPTDAHAAGCLLDALKKNKKAKVYAVIGPANPESPRLHGMLSWARPPSAMVHMQDLYCQDLFAVLTRDRLF